MGKKIFVTLGVVSVVFMATVVWAQEVTVTVGNGSGAPGDIVGVPITASDTTASAINSCDITLRYNPTLLTLSDVEAGTLTSAWEREVQLTDVELAQLTVPWHYPVYKETSGEVKIALYGTSNLSGAGTLATLIFKVNATATGSTTLSLTKAQFKEGAVSSALVNGSFTINTGGVVGDVDKNGAVNSLDVQACVNHILGVQDYGNAADVNKDTLINSLDIQRIVNIILGV